jgi:hypothetical protein
MSSEKTNSAIYFINFLWFLDGPDIGVSGFSSQFRRYIYAFRRQRAVRAAFMGGSLGAIGCGRASIMTSQVEMAGSPPLGFLADYCIGPKKLERFKKLPWNAKMFTHVHSIYIYTHKFTFLPFGRGNFDHLATSLADPAPEIMVH